MFEAGFTCILSKSLMNTRTKKRDLCIQVSFFVFMSAGHNIVTSKASTSFDSLLSTSLSVKRT